MATACGGAGGGSGTPSESAPSSLLPGGGTGSGLPAQGLALDEIGFDFGASDAPIKVVEFSDFGCGYCRRFHIEEVSHPDGRLHRDGEGAVEVRDLRKRHVPERQGRRAGGRVRGRTGTLRTHEHPALPGQPEWRSEPDPADVFEALAVESGADARQYRACVAEDRPAERLRSGFLTGARLGVRGTPTFIINGVPLVGDQPLSMWADIFTAIGAAAANASAPGGGAPPPEPRP